MPPKGANDGRAAATARGWHGAHRQRKDGVQHRRLRAAHQHPHFAELARCSRHPGSRLVPALCAPGEGVSERAASQARPTQAARRLRDTRRYITLRRPAWLQEGGKGTRMASRTGGWLVWQQRHCPSASSACASRVRVPAYRPLSSEAQAVAQLVQAPEAAHGGADCDVPCMHHGLPPTAAADLLCVRQAMRSMSSAVAPRMTRGKGLRGAGQMSSTEPTPRRKLR